MKTLKQIQEELTTPQKSEVDKWEKSTPKVKSATDHYFGKDADSKTTPLADTEDKSEIHKKIEHHLGVHISSADYKEGKTTDGQLLLLMLC